MNIRRATDRDIPDVLRLLSQVLEVHAAIRPDIFVSGTTKYGEEDLKEMFVDDLRPVYVAVDDDENVAGYAFCQIQDPPVSRTMVPRKTLYIDDLCVDEKARGAHIGSLLFDHVRSEAKRLGCHEITLDVWEGNAPAASFYESRQMKPRKNRMELIIS